MQIFDAAQITFAEAVAEHLFDAERRLRAATQLAERAPLGTPEHGTIRLSRSDARTVLRAILPACIALGRTRRPTLALNGALAAFHAALIDVRDPTMIGPAITAALDLSATLAEWIDEARWKQATVKAGKAWRRHAENGRSEEPINAVMRQSTGEKPEQRANAAPPPVVPASAPKRARAKHQAPGQGTIMLPLRGGKAEARAATPAIEHGAATARERAA